MNNIDIIKTFFKYYREHLELMVTQGHYPIGTSCWDNINIGESEAMAMTNNGTSISKIIEFIESNKSNYGF